jgi:hypothetical protein
MKRKSIYDNISEALDRSHKARLELEEQQSKVQEQGRIDQMMVKLEAQRKQDELRRAPEIAPLDKQIELACIQAGIVTNSTL